MRCTICDSDAWYVCGRSGRPLCPEHSRIEIVTRLSFGSSDSLTVREAQPPDYEQLVNLAGYFGNESKSICFGKEYAIANLPAFVVSANDHLSGALTYSLEEDSLAVITLDVLPGYQGLGAGKMLIEAAKNKASAEGKSSVIVSAPNDDLPAIYFYQRNGFRIYEVNPDAIALNHGGVKVGFAGITSQDEIRLHYTL